FSMLFGQKCIRARGRHVVQTPLFLIFVSSMPITKLVQLDLMALGMMRKQLLYERVMANDSYLRSLTGLQVTEHVVSATVVKLVKHVAKSAAKFQVIVRSLRQFFPSQHPEHFRSDTAPGKPLLDFI